MLLGVALTSAESTPVASDPSTEVIPDEFAQPHCCGSIVSTGEEAYLFGGWLCDDSGTCVKDRSIYEVDEDGVNELSTELPRGLTHSAAVWDPRNRPEAGCSGGCAYIFGGWDGWPHEGINNPQTNDVILRFNPESGTVEELDETLPTARGGASATWAGEAAYIFGGYTSSGPADDILRFDPEEETVSPIAETLPTPKYGMAAACAGADVYLLGGSENGFDDFEQSTSSIVRFRIPSQTATELDATLPARWTDGAAVTAGSHVYLVGGSVSDTSGSTSDRILRMDLHDPGSQTDDVSLPEGTAESGAAWLGDRIGLPAGGDGGSLAHRTGLQTVQPGAPDGPAGPPPCGLPGT